MYVNKFSHPPDCFWYTKVWNSRSIDQKGNMVYKLDMKSEKCSIKTLSEGAESPVLSLNISSAALLNKSFSTRIYLCSIFGCSCESTSLVSKWWLTTFESLTLTLPIEGFIMDYDKRTMYS